MSRFVFDAAIEAEIGEQALLALWWLLRDDLRESKATPGVVQYANLYKPHDSPAPTVWRYDPPRRRFLA